MMKWSAWCRLSLLAVSATGFERAFVLSSVRRSDVRRRISPLRMGWGGEVQWQDVEVRLNDKAAKGMRTIVLEVSPETAATFHTGGQFVQLKQGDGNPGFYAIASPPANSTSFEFLIKETESNVWLTSATTGTTLSMSDVSGKGFDTKSNFDGDAGEINSKYDGFQCMNVLFFACGSGISPIRSTIESGVAIELPKPAKLYYGVRDADSRAYADRYDKWRTDFNVEVVEVQSRPLSAWTGPTGYVQDVLKATGVEVPRNTGACICGKKDMYLAVRDILLEAGVFEGRILTNF